MDFDFAYRARQLTLINPVVRRQPVLGALNRKDDVGRIVARPGGTDGKPLCDAASEASG